MDEAGQSPGLYAGPQAPRVGFGIGTGNVGLSRTNGLPRPADAWTARPSPPFTFRHPGRFPNGPL